MRKNEKLNNVFNSDLISSLFLSSYLHCFEQVLLMRKCIRCNTEKYESEFATKSRIADTGTCRICCYAANRRYNELNREKIRDHARETRYRLTEESLAVSGKNVRLGKLTVPQLLKIFNSNDVDSLWFVENNCIIDKVMCEGIAEIRYRRTCLSCDETFIGHGRFHRRCNRCKRVVK